MRRLLPGALLLLLITLAGCQPAPQNRAGLSGRILLWHSWGETETGVLEQVLARFSEINPRAKIISVAIPPDELLEQYEKSTFQGFGPDLLLGSSDWVRQLAEAELIQPLDPNHINAASYLPAALEALRYRGRLYGFPLSLYPPALYYNTSLVEQPALTLDQLLAQAHEGKSVALIPRFEAAYWGLQTFGSGLFDAAGNFTLAQSGFAPWLAWLNEAQNEPGLILNPDGAALQGLFIEGRVAYYVAGPAELPNLQQLMGEETVGVAPLPAGPHGPSGPLLPVEAILLSPTSSAEQVRLALAVANYLTNPQQNITFMRVLNRVPANQRVEVDPRIYPIVAGFARQSQTAVAWPNNLPREALYTLGDTAYAGVLSGVLTPDQAVCDVGLAFISLQSYTAEAAALPAGCTPNQAEE